MNAPPSGTRDRAHQRVGQVLRGKWRLDELLAVGGMASVYAATHRNGKRGAVKLLHYDLSLNDESRTRFLREGYVANKVDHEGAVSVLDDDMCEDGTVFLVMELLEGQTIDALLTARNAKTLGLGETLRIADRLLDVLAGAHFKGIVHRDIKPENLFVTLKGGLKVLDFGIARLRETAASAGHTRAGDLLGTPNFMPPEQALGNTEMIDARSDLWSVGATIFRLLAGRPVHHAESINRVLLAAMTMPAPPMSRALPSVPRQLAIIVDRALAFDQRDRWPDATLMREAVRAFAEGTGLRLDGHVLDTAEEARARPNTLPIEREAAQPPARPPPVAGRQVYTPGSPGVPMAAPSSGAPERRPAAPVPFAMGALPPAPSIDASAYPSIDAADVMSVDGLMADADDCDDDAQTRLRDPLEHGRVGPPSGYPMAMAPPSGPRSGPPGPAPSRRTALLATTPFGPAHADPMDDRPTTALPSSSPYGNSAGDRATAALPSSPPYGNATSDRPGGLAPSLTPAFHMGDRPITMAPPSHTPSFATASPVSPEGTFGFAPRSTRIAPFVVLGAMAVLGGIAALVLIDVRSSTPASQPPATATVIVTVPAAPTVPAPSAPTPSAPPAPTASPAPTATVSTAPAAPPTATASAAVSATSKPKPQPSTPAASTASTAKTSPSATQKRPPPAGSSKGDPFSSRKW